ncbi:unnamed protein product [Ceratitis capitata]|uniref:(Mediterranean fruit fly) hypothetical protein n=1 Tax=Ceratitis capitata TaxID=7213 RepID=A0A811VEG5_CERCA|nr:unnamed protein product [Ceratitis capitata]
MLLFYHFENGAAHGCLNTYTNSPRITLPNCFMHVMAEIQQRGFAPVFSFDAFGTCVGASTLSCKGVLISALVRLCGSPVSDGYLTAFYLSRSGEYIICRGFTLAFTSLRPNEIE